LKLDFLESWCVDGAVMWIGCHRECLCIILSLTF
jgi:hypothetical protein